MYRLPWILRHLFQYFRELGPCEGAIHPAAIFILAAEVYFITRLIHS